MDRIYEIKWYFKNFLMASYRGTEEKIIKDIISSGDDVIIFQEGYEKVAPNKMLLKDDDGIIVTLELLK